LPLVQVQGELVKGAICVCVEDNFKHRFLGWRMLHCLIVILHFILLSVCLLCDLLSSLVTVVCMFFFSLPFAGSFFWSGYVFLWALPWSSTTLLVLLPENSRNVPMIFTDPWLEEDGYPSSWSSRGSVRNVSIKAKFVGANIAGF
ncbi:hypothetical protein L9F63_005496, partial [Diploptera punctata]